MRNILLCLCLLAGFEGRAYKILFSEFGKGNETYWLIEPVRPDVKTAKLVVFLHGHGASNPDSYGNWILHLADQGYMVVFPKFQTGVFIPDPVAEEARIDANIDSAQAYLDRKYGKQPRQLHFIGHSLGGLLAANLADDYGGSGKYKVSSLTLVQPGHKYLKLGSLDSYNHLDSTVRIVCVSGSNDRTAGTTFSSYLMQHSPHVPSSQKIHFLLEKKRHRGETIGSTHEEPVCPNSVLDGGNHNPIIRGARLIGQTDRADYCFWKTADALIADPAELQLKNLADIGKWKDGTAIGKMQVMTDNQ